MFNTPCYNYRCNSTYFSATLMKYSWTAQDAQMIWMFTQMWAVFPAYVVITYVCDRNEVFAAVVYHKPNKEISATNTLMRSVFIEIDLTHRPWSSLDSLIVHFVIQIKRFDGLNCRVCDTVYSQGFSIFRCRGPSNMIIPVKGTPILIFKKAAIISCVKSELTLKIII